MWRGPATLGVLATTWPQFFTALLPKALIIAALVSMWEETGWAGFMLPRLPRRIGLLPASLLVNTSQAMLHVPLIFAVDGLSDGRIPVVWRLTYAACSVETPFGLVRSAWRLAGGGVDLELVVPPGTSAIAP